MFCRHLGLNTDSLLLVVLSKQPFLHTWETNTSWDKYIPQICFTLTVTVEARDKGVGPKCRRRLQVTGAAV